MLKNVPLAAVQFAGHRFGLKEHRFWANTQAFRHQVSRQHNDEHGGEQANRFIISGHNLKI